MLFPGTGFNYIWWKICQKKKNKNARLLEECGNGSYKKTIAEFENHV